jgi:fatty acyl-CoA reductase
VRNGRITGELLAAPPTGETRAAILADYAAAHDCDLGESVAYADSTSDLPMLELVGFPVAVNPETRLSALARKRGWLVEQWDPASGGPAGALPLGGRWSASAGRTPLLERLVNAGSSVVGTSGPAGNTGKRGRS